jgi:4-amino-4-deoxy-L-arabinose transferase-like glycosyltransferase
LWLAAIWSAGALLRLAFVFLEPQTRPIADETMWLMALNRIPAAEFSPFSNYPIFHPPLYPYFLAAVNAVFGSLLAIKLIQALISSLLIPAMFRIALKTSGPRASILSAAFAAFYPELIWYAAHFWCETLFLTLVWWAVERLIAADELNARGPAIAAGVLFGLAVLTRETVLYLLPLGALWLARREPRRPALAATVVLAAFAVVAPWTLRNWIQFDSFIPVSTGGGLNLYQGNAPLSRNEVYGEYYANEGKVEQYRWARSAGLKVIWERQPAWIFEKLRDEGPRLAEIDSLALIHMRRGAYGAVGCSTYRGVALIVLAPWILIGIGTVVALSRPSGGRVLLLLVGLLGAYLMLHVATHGFSRYRLPVLPAFMILSASLVEPGVMGSRGQRVRLAVLALALALLWAPSFVDQLGHLGLAAPPLHEGFALICPAP